MTFSSRRRLRALLFTASALTGLGLGGACYAEAAPSADAPVATAAPAADASADGAGTPAATSSEVVVSVSKTTRSSVILAGSETQKILPGINPLKAIETLPGVVFETADPWGADEQNEAIFVHGFSTQQLGYTMDGVPLGDQQYGNYNGLSPYRAVISENVGRVELSSGAGALGVASTSNLGGAIETYSSDPSHTMGADVRETLGSYYTTRTYLRLDTGDIGDSSGYLSYAHQSARAWDFQGYQGGDQVNAKYVHNDERGKLTLFADYSQKTDPNEDAINYGNQQTAAGQGFIPYTRPYQYPNLAGEIASLTNAAGVNTGGPPASQGNNFSNYFSAEQRTDLLGYAQYDYKLASNLTWSNQFYYHYDYGRGIVAGPINQAGLPSLFATYYPNLVVGGSATSAGSIKNLIGLFGGTGLEVRTTEYHINRYGERSNLDWDLGAHQIEVGIWYEHNDSGQHRVWYPFSGANNDLTPYDIPKGPAVLTQDAVDFSVDDVQTHIQDNWRILPTLLLSAGFKSTYQSASNDVLVQQVGGDFPTGTITTTKAFLPQFGAVWDVTDHEQLFANIQENVRQFIPYSQGGGFYGTSPWSLANQAAFNLFKSTVQPETSWTYEAGVRTHRPVNLGWLTSVDGQANYYHVDFSNRILNIAPYNFINPAPSILVNVGGVTTNGVDAAGTLNFGSHFHVYNSVSYNSSTYDSNYNSGTTNGQPTVVHIAGKQVPGEPNWTDKTIVSVNYGPFEAQLSGDYIGRRYATYLNDMWVQPTWQGNFEASYDLAMPADSVLKEAKISVNITNIADIKGASTVAVTSASGGYQAYPVAPRMGFVTLQGKF
jgi:iron complex outermembrane recepter protein